MAALKTYTVTVDGTINGETLTAPFTIEVHQVSYISRDGFDDEGNPVDESYLSVVVCTKANDGSECKNDDIANRHSFSMPSMGASKNADLSANFEPLLDTVYGSGNWS